MALLQMNIEKESIGGPLFDKKPNIFILVIAFMVEIQKRIIKFFLISSSTWLDPFTEMSRILRTT